jgi:regulator of sigma E protease
VVAKDSAAEIAGLQVGDKLLAINGQSVGDDWQAFAQQIQQYPEQLLTLTVVRDQRQLLVEVTPKARDSRGKKIGYLGVSPKSDSYPENYRIELVYGPVQALGASIEKTWDLITLSFDMIGKLITGQLSVKNLSGPIAIAQGAGDHAGYGFVYFLGFLALISINLGIINILPIPVLDGGHLVYYFIELLTGKPVSDKVQEIGFKFGALALLGLMSIALFNDLSRL